MIVDLSDGADVTAEVEYYTFDRVEQIRRNSTQSLDSGNGFVFDDKNGEQTQFGYAAAPTKLLEQLGESETTHSPLIGWAFDGNPIYGPHVYENGRNASGGIKVAYSGYQTPEDRSTIKASSGTVTPTNPPAIGTYPMGTFLDC